MLKCRSVGKKYKESSKKIDSTKRYDFNEAIDAAISSSYAKFDETVDVAVRLGVDPRHADQMVRGTVILPNGLGKEVKVLVFAKGEKEMEAKEAGAEFVGNEDLVEKIKEGWFGFDKAIATPDMMGTVGKIGRLLGPRGLMPNAKTGTVTFDVAKNRSGTESRKDRIPCGKSRNRSCTDGEKVSFGSQKIVENIAAFLETIMKLKPSSSKGTYLKAIAVSTTMGPGIKIDTALVKDFVK